MKLLVVMLLTIGAFAEEMPDAPGRLMDFGEAAWVISVRPAKLPKIADRNFWLVSAATLASAVGDVITSNRAETRGCYETNPILGRHPSSAKISAYLLGTAVAANMAGFAVKRITRNKKGFWRQVWYGPQIGYSTVEAKAAIHNAGLICR